MLRKRVCITVGASLLEQARRLRPEMSDAALLDAVRGVLIERHRFADIEASYAAYDDRPLDEPDEWGDLASFGAAASSS